MRFAFTPNQSERIEAVVTVPKEQRAVLHGTVYDMDGKRIPDAVVRLFLCSGDALEPTADTFTDGDGEFVFGPIETESSYVVKVYVGGVTLREITVRPKKKRIKT
jgi:hypothetical protein